MSGKNFKKRPFRFQPYTFKVNYFIKSLNPNLHSVNCHSVEAVWFLDKSSHFILHFNSSNEFRWHIIRIGADGECGWCNNFKEMEKLVLEKLKKGERV